jgi:hypothetical protein
MAPFLKMLKEISSHMRNGETLNKSPLDTCLDSVHQKQCAAPARINWKLTYLDFALGCPCNCTQFLHNWLLHTISN